VARGGRELPSLTASERRAIRETRVRIVGARHGETIGGIVGV